MFFNSDHDACGKRITEDRKIRWTLQGIMASASHPLSNIKPWNMYSQWCDELSVTRNITPWGVCGSLMQEMRQVGGRLAKGNSMEWWGTKSHGYVERGGGREDRRDSCESCTQTECHWVFVTIMVQWI